MSDTIEPNRTFSVRDSIVFQREACERMGVLIGRDFPPLTNWARVSIGTADEMRVANDVFKKVLAAPAATASR